MQLSPHVTTPEKQTAILTDPCKRKREKDRLFFPHKMTKILNKYYDTLPYLASEFGILEGKVNKLNTLVYIQQQFLWCVSFTVYHIVSGLLSLSSLVCPWRMVEGTGLLHHGMHVFSLMFSQQGMSNIFVYIYIQVFFMVYGLLGLSLWVFMCMCST